MTGGKYTLRFRVTSAEIECVYWEQPAKDVLTIDMLGNVIGLSKIQKGEHGINIKSS
jgi:hypothetical protein